MFIWFPESDEKHGLLAADLINLVIDAQIIFELTFVIPHLNFFFSQSTFTLAFKHFKVSIIAYVYFLSDKFPTRLTWESPEDNFPTEIIFSFSSRGQFFDIFIVLSPFLKQL